MIRKWLELQDSLYCSRLSFVCDRESSRGFGVVRTWEVLGFGGKSRGERVDEFGE